MDKNSEHQCSSLEASHVGVMVTDSDASMEAPLTASRKNHNEEKLHVSMFMFRASLFILAA